MQRLDSRMVMGRLLVSIVAALSLLEPNSVSAAGYRRGQQQRYVRDWLLRTGNARYVDQQAAFKAGAPTGYSVQQASAMPAPAAQAAPARSPPRIFIISAPAPAPPAPVGMPHASKPAQQSSYPPMPTGQSGGGSAYSMQPVYAMPVAQPLPMPQSSYPMPAFQQPQHPHSAPPRRAMTYAVAAPPRRSQHSPYPMPSAPVAMPKPMPQSRPQSSSAPQPQSLSVSEAQVIFLRVPQPAAMPAAARPMPMPKPMPSYQIPAAAPQRHPPQSAPHAPPQPPAHPQAQQSAPSRPETLFIVIPAPAPQSSAGSPSSPSSSPSSSYMKLAMAPTSYEHAVVPACPPAPANFCYSKYMGHYGHPDDRTCYIVCNNFGHSFTHRCAKGTKWKGHGDEAPSGYNKCV